MKIEQVKEVYFLGIGGIGMSALARYFMSKDIPVSGYDRTPSSLTNALIKEGAIINFEDDIDHIPISILNNKDSLFIYTPAIPVENKIYLHLLDLQKKLYKRSEILGLLSKKYKTIGIAGTHGKTTISSITAHLFNKSPLGCLAFLGGITKNYNSNLISHPNSPWMVVEADEYDRSFLTLFPEIALISSMDADHLDIYGNQENLIRAFQQFVQQRSKNGHLIYKHNLATYFSSLSSTYSYDIEDKKADFYATNIHLKNNQYHFNLSHPNGLIKDLNFPMAGKINLENAVAACSIAIISGIDEAHIRQGLNSFLGIKRRMELILKNKNIIYYDDYAHHPKEINASIDSLQQLYPDKELTLVFQPHLYSRTQDFAADFAKSLSKAHRIILLDIYPAREKPIDGVSSESIRLLMLNKNAKTIKKEELIKELKNNKPELLLSLGAGDIDRFVEPIKLAFL